MVFLFSSMLLRHACIAANAQGTDVPAPLSVFADLSTWGVPQRTIERISEHHPKPTPIQVMFLHILFCKRTWASFNSCTVSAAPSAWRVCLGASTLFLYTPSHRHAHIDHHAQSVSILILPILPHACPLSPQAPRSLFSISLHASMAASTGFSHTQMQAMPVMLADREVLGVAPTGWNRIFIACNFFLIE